MGIMELKVGITIPINKAYAIAVVLGTGITSRWSLFLRTYEKTCNDGKEVANPIKTEGITKIQL